MSTEVNEEKPMDFNSEIDSFISNKLRELEVKREKDREAREKSDSEYWRAEQERRTFLVTGNNRSTEIIRESGLREILEQAKTRLTGNYPRAVLLERYSHNDYERRDDSKIAYQFRLAWQTQPEIYTINFWGDVVNSQDFHYFDVWCSGWKKNISYVTKTRTICCGFLGSFSTTREEAVPIISYEREDSLVIFCGLHDGIKLLNDEWQNSEKVKQAIVEAIKNPMFVKRSVNKGGTIEHGYSGSPGSGL